MKLGPVRHDTRCAVCWGTMKKVKVVSPCLHRFCAKCIEEHIRKLCVSPPQEARESHPSFSLAFPARCAAIDDPSSRIGTASGLTSPGPLPRSSRLDAHPETSTTARSNNYCPTCRVHIPSRRALRDDPDFDKTVTTLYANAPDYDRRENAYSAHVTKQSMAAEKQAREQERIAKKIRAEEAAKQAAEMREKYRAEAEIRAKAKAEADAVAAAERDAAAAERAAVAEAAAEAAAEETRQRLEREHNEAVEREKRTLAAEEARREANGGDDATENASRLEDADGDGERDADRKRGGADIAETPKKRARKSSGKSSGSEKEKKSARGAAVPAFTSKPVQRGGVTVVEMPDDFAGLYAMRVADDKARLTVAGKSEKGEKGSHASASSTIMDEIRAYRIELKRLSADGGVGLLKSPHALVPAAATVDVVKRLIGEATAIPEASVRVFSEDTQESGDLDGFVSVADAVLGQIRAGAADLELRYSVV